MKITTRAARGALAAKRRTSPAPQYPRIRAWERSTCGSMQAWRIKDIRALFPIPLSHKELSSVTRRERALKNMLRYGFAVASRSIRICASTAAIALMLTTRRTVDAGVSTCAGFATPIKIGPMPTPSVIERTRL